MKENNKGELAMETVVKWILILLGLGLLMGVLFLAKNFIMDKIIGGF